MDFSLRRVLLAYGATVHTSTDFFPFKMLTGCELKVCSNIFLQNKEVATVNAPEHVLRLKEGLRKTLNIAR